MKRSILILVLLALAIGVYAFSMNWRSFVPGNTPNSGAPAAGDAGRYESAELGLAFRYPNTSYDLTVQQDGNAERTWYTLVFLPKGYVPSQGGEGPATIAITRYPNPENLPAKAWILTDARSNFKLSADQTMATTSVGGEVAYSYTHSGLYETDSVATMHDGYIYVFTAGWQTPQDITRMQLQQLLGTVEFL